MGVYNSLLISYPLATKMGTAAAIASLGDTSCQYITLGRYDNRRRTLNQAGIACFCAAPMFHVYMKLVFPHLTTPRFLSTVILRVLAHALLVTPYMQSVFLVGLRTLQTNSIQEGINIWKKKFLTLYMQALMFWPAATVLFYLGYIPLRYGNLWMDCFGLLWAIYLSYFNNKK